MENFKTKVLIDMEDKGYGVCIAAKLQRMGLYAVVKKEKIDVFEREMMFEKYRIVVTDDTESYNEACIQTMIISEDENIIDSILCNENILYVSKKIGIDSICSLIRFSANSGGDKTKAERAASKFLRDIGIHTNLKGYRYLRTGIVMATLKPEIMESSTYEIYDAVAEKYNVQSQNVERAMRNSIEVAYDISPSRVREKFTYPVQKPTNTELIMYASDTIRTWGM